MDKLLERMSHYSDFIGKKDAETSAYGRKFVSSLSLVMVNIGEGKSMDRNKGEWIFAGCEFADQRKNTFTFRPKFAKLMSKTDLSVALIIIEQLHTDTEKGCQLMPHAWENTKAENVFTTCKEIRSALEGV